MLVLSAGSGAERRARDLVGVDETGLAERVDAPSLPYFRVRISPDGTHAAIDMTDFENIYVLNLERGGTPRLLTFADESGFFPIWSPDGRDLIYTNRDDAEAGLARKNIDGIGPARTFVSRVELIFPWTVTSDGATLLATSFGAETTGLDLFTVSLNEPHEFDLLIDDPGSQAEATLSPDGKWLAYSSNETGVTEIYVRPYPSLAGKWQVSTGYGLGPRWDRDGKRLYYRSSDSMMAVDIEATASSFVAGEPRELFRTPYHDNATNSAYDRSPIDGRFLMIKLHTRSGESDELMVVDNWTTEIARLAPAADR